MILQVVLVREDQDEIAAEVISYDGRVQIIGPKAEMVRNLMEDMGRVQQPPVEDLAEVVPTMTRRLRGYVFAREITDSERVYRPEGAEQVHRG